MAAVVERGPLPKREGERRRTNKTTESGESNEVTKVEVDPATLEDVSDVKAPPAPEHWDSIAIDLYESHFRSAMRVFYEPTDWQILYTLCDQLDRHLKPQPIMVEGSAVVDDDGDPIMRTIPMPGSTLSAIMKELGNLGSTEGARRRLRIEVDRTKKGSTMPNPAAQGANVIAMRGRRLSS